MIVINMREYVQIATLPLFILLLHSDSVNVADI